MMKIHRLARPWSLSCAPWVLRRFAEVSQRTISAALLLMLLAHLQTKANQVITLSDGWRCQSSAVTDGTWYEATVPSTVMGVLTTQKGKKNEYPNLLEGMNYKGVDKSRFRVPWIYEKDFRLDGLSPQEHVTLLFEGVGYSANIRLNGQLVASRDSVRGPFRTYELDVTPLAREHNTLSVEVFAAQPGDPNIGFVDWNPWPADENMGIWRPVSVKRSGAVTISHPFVKTRLNLSTLDEAWLTVEADVRNLSGQACSGSLRGEIEGSTFSVPYTLKPYEQKTLRITADDAPALYVRHPRLWWCYTLGKPELYTLRLHAGSGQQVSDETTVRFGIRETSSFITNDGYRAFTLNGKRIQILGAGWTDDLFLRDTPDRYRQQLELVRQMNLNTVRLEGFWGTSQALYDLCDEMGILLLAGWSCHWEWEEYLGKPVDPHFGGITSPADIRLVSDQFADQLRYLRHHPSIIAWFTGSDRLPLPALESEYIRIKNTVDDRPQIISAKQMESDLTGTSGTKMEGPYEYVAPSYWYHREAPGGAFGFNTETCTGANLPVRESIEQMIGPHCWPIDSVWDYHCTSSASAFNNLQVLSQTIAGRYGEATSFDDYLRKASMVGYDGTRAMFDAFRYRFPTATGVVQWMLGGGARPGLYWQLYDYYLRPTAAYYSVRKACEPVQLIYDYLNREVRAVNSLLHSVTVTARMKVYGVSGQLLEQQEKQLTIPANGHADAFTLAPLAEANAYLFLFQERAGGEASSPNVYTLSTDEDRFDWAKSDWTGTPMLHHASHHAIGAARVEGCRISETHRTAYGKTIVTLTVSNPTDRVAYFLRLSLRTPRGRLIDGVTFSDNYISLEPHTSRTVTCEFSGQQKFRAVIQ